EPSDIDTALLDLERTGAIMRGEFLPGAQWCERALLARIHRHTLDRLRREIEPVTAAQFAQFLTRWQRAHPDRRMDGVEGLFAVIEQLAGYAVPARSWEPDVLAMRMRSYDPSWLDGLCLMGRVAWSRPPGRSSGTSPVGSTPIVVAPRSSLSFWFRTEGDEVLEPLGHEAEAVLGALHGAGALFFDDLVSRTHLLATRVEQALGELVAKGLVRSDAFDGLRSLVAAPDRRPRARSRGRLGPGRGAVPTGRWTTVENGIGGNPDDALEFVAERLLKRWGVVFRRMTDVEGQLPPWRDLLRVYRRWEARGDIRGGRFVEGFAGEQFALPEAVTDLRSTRRSGAEGVYLSVSAADPLNLTGFIVPGDRVPSLSGNRLLLLDGVPVAALEKREVRWFGAPPEGVLRPFELEKMLRRREQRPTNGTTGASGRP
ncbi:MAG: DEAD/DEAH box helicase, partial [Myxococcales bacterium]|nr:DEAD/DEAH box helicase [Myxococcales bacterium]